VVDFIQRAGIVTAMVGLLQALPGTRLYKRLKATGRLLESNSGDNVDGTTNIVPTAGVALLRDGYKHGLQHLYSPKLYYRRVRTFLREYRMTAINLPRGFRYRVGQLMAFARSVGRLGLVGTERVEYWKLLVWTVFRRPRAFGLAVMFAIYGYHFRRTCDAHLA
jgi:hypothetical protein